MGTDLPDDSDEPSGDHSDPPAERFEDADNRGTPAGRQRAARAEARSRDECYEDLRAATGGVPSRERRTTEPGGAAETQERAASAKRWDGVPGWPDRVRAGSSRGDGDQFPDRSTDGELRPERARIAEIEEKKITPAMLEIESRDPDRRLVGFECRLKSGDRIDEKAAEVSKALGHSAKEALSLMPDAIRYTFEYDDGRYCQGVLADIARMKAYGFELDTVKNYWSDDQYKGINSQWIEPESRQRFELQFHTRISFEAKQITHPAYERLRSQPKPDELEDMVLRGFQREVSAAIPIPPGAADMADYPKRARNAG